MVRSQRPRQAAQIPGIAGKTNIQIVCSVRTAIENRTPAPDDRELHICVNQGLNRSFDIHRFGLRAAPRRGIPQSGLGPREFLGR
jgi:hypothetical protein